MAAIGPKRLPSSNEFSSATVRRKPLRALIRPLGDVADNQAVQAGIEKGHAVLQATIELHASSVPQR
jgi:hypothetical protein